MPLFYSCRFDGSFSFPPLYGKSQGGNMKNKRNLNQTARQVFESLQDGPVLITPDGQIVKENASSFSFTVFANNEDERNKLVDLFRKQDYSIDLEALPGLSGYFPQLLFKVDVQNKRVTNPLIVSVRHYEYLRDKESILAVDVLDNFDELVIKQNKKLAESLVQYNKKKQRRN